MAVSRHLAIHGRVQGVFYRGWAVETARALGLSGWVRNRRDGSVEAVVTGDAAAVADFVARCHGGPPAARVDRVDVTETAPATVAGFEQRPTE
ncbi:acylphosphatase [Edaphosphingomonas haloaromaticamans]|uniref:acylphosphatase n=1 Tax=Edaphosphingomonas haloaromaticamans TaxID=653954 RepID=A0A1S1HGK1_9SPHN|nr:acylphosphatase [Sphingomonas haloaromaticamans]OHT21419.1 Acylphosphatase [Sphingomonas haloaromaticamans]